MYAFNFIRCILFAAVPTYCLALVPVHGGGKGSTELAHRSCARRIHMQLTSTLVFTVGPGWSLVVGLAWLLSEIVGSFLLARIGRPSVCRGFGGRKRNSDLPCCTSITETAPCARFVSRQEQFVSHQSDLIVGSPEGCFYSNYEWYVSSVLAQAV